MQHSSRLSLHISLCWALIVILLSACEVQAKADLFKFFTEPVPRYKPDTNDGGGCKDHAADLQSSYSEASEVSQMSLEEKSVVLTSYRLIR